MNNRRVLIVDDDSKSRIILEKHLTSFGLEVVSAHDGDEAIEILSEDPYFDLIITDIMMPYMTGFDLVSRLKGYNNTKDIPIIAVSAFHDWKGSRKSHELDVDGFISKPFNREDLINEIRKVIGDII